MKYSNWEDRSYDVSKRGEFKGVLYQSFPLKINQYMKILEEAARTGGFLDHFSVFE